MPTAQPTHSHDPGHAHDPNKPQDPSSQGGQGASASKDAAGQVPVVNVYAFSVRLKGMQPGDLAITVYVASDTPEQATQDIQDGIGDNLATLSGPVTFAQGAFNTGNSGLPLTSPPPPPSTQTTPPAKLVPTQPTKANWPGYGTTPPPPPEWQNQPANPDQTGADQSGAAPASSSASSSDSSAKGKK